MSGLDWQADLQFTREHGVPDMLLCCSAWEASGRAVTVRRVRKRVGIVSFILVVVRVVGGLVGWCVGEGLLKFLWKSWKLVKLVESRMFGVEIRERDA